MKKIVLVFIICASIVRSQNTGTQIIYGSGNFGIKIFNSFKPLNTGIMDIYIQLGLYDIQSGSNESGRYLKLNKSNYSWYIPYNGFINSAWGMGLPSGYYDCQPIPFFAISPVDSNQIIKFRITPAAECPDATTHYTTNCGVSYSYTPFNCGGVIIFPYGGDYNPKRNNELLFGYGNGTSGIFKSTNAGVNWSMMTPISDLRESVGANSYVYWCYGFVKYNPFDTAFVYANGINNINISTNGGYNFSVLPVKWMKGIIFSPKDSVIYGYNDYKLYKTYNKGLSWDSAQSVVKFSSLEVNPDLSNILYGGDSNGIYISTNYGSNWSLYNNSFSPSKVIIGISKDPGSADTFYAATTKNVYKIWASFLVGVQNGNNIIPEKFSLSQNYPNPFNPRTVIRCQLSVVGTNRQRTTNNVQLIVFDITGKEITTLVNEQLQAGTYEVTFDGSNLPSGVYFYKLRAEKYSETKKMLMIK